MSLFIDILLLFVYLTFAACVCLLYRTALYKVFPTGKNNSYATLSDNEEAVCVGILFPIVAPFAFALLYARWRDEHPKVKKDRAKTRHEANL